MKSAPIFGVAFSILLLASCTEALAEAPVPPKELTLVFVDSLKDNQSDLNNYDRIVRVFKHELENQKHPIKVVAERFASNITKHEIELQIFFQGIRPETYQDLTFAAWMIVRDHDTKRDLGVIRYRYDFRPFEPVEDRLEIVVRGAAQMVAPRIDAFLFPNEDGPKQKP